MKKCYKKVASGLMGVLGFSGCSALENEPVVMYGVPQGDFKVNSVVTDESGNPIKNIEVELFQVDSGDTTTNYYSLDKTTTDQQGKAVSSCKAVLWDKWAIAYRDTDGEENGGSFLSDTVKLDLSTFTQKKSGEGWNTGEYEKDLSVKLKKK